MVIKLPLKVRLTTDEESARLAQLRAAVNYTPRAGFLLDEPLTRLPERVYCRRPGSKTRRKIAL